MADTPRRYRLTNGKLKAIEKSSAPANVIEEPPYVEGWISPEVIDRSGEVVPVDEWDLSQHEKNPVAFLNHNHKGPIVGKWQHPDGRYAIEKRDGGLWGRCYFNMAIPEGRAECEAYRSGFKKAFSPRFEGIPRRGTFKGQPATVIRKATLWEASLVGLPDNQAALATFCKSLATSPGNDDRPIPTGHVLRFGAIAMAELNPIPPADAPTGLKAYYAKMAGILDAVDEAKKTLLAELPDGDERNRTYGLLQPVYTFMKSLPEVGKQSAPDHDWVGFEKRVDEVFEGFEKSVADAATIDEAALDARIKAVVQTEIAEPINRINELQDTIARVDGDVSGVLEVVEAIAN